MALSQQELFDLVRRAVVVYNKYRSPEAIVRLVSFLPEKVTVEFSSSFCYGCGVQDFFEDLIYEFKMLNGKADLKNWEDKANEWAKSRG